MQELQKEQIVISLHKLMNGIALSETERVLLEEWKARSTYNKELYDQVINNPEALRREVKTILNNGSSSALWKKIKSQLPSEQERPVSIFRHRKFLRYMAAAAVLLAVGLGAWFFFFNKATDEQTIASNQPQSTNTTDIPPGTDGAVLTLSDGKQIILDNTGNGEIAQEGKAKVIKSEDGQLVYQLSDKDHLGAKPIYNSVSTQKGNQYRIILPDGSKVWLNSESSIHYPAVFAGNERRVTVTGELYFEIAKDKSKPFRVTITPSPLRGEGRGEVHGEVEVLGTHFNINAYTDEATINTTVLEGLVKISSNKKNSFIKPGQQARLNTNGDIKVVNDTDIEQTMAWVKGLFIFKKDDIETIMRQVSRWYGAEVVFEDKISGHFVATLPRNQPVSKLLEKLEMTKDVRFEIKQNKIIVRR